MILSELSLSQLIVQAERRDFTKWWSLCLMRGIGLPTLDAALIEPTASSNHAKEIFERFSDKIESESVLVRSDSSAESKKYARGGITYPASQGWKAVSEFLDIGRAVIILEPTNRYSNRVSINMTVSLDGDWIAEGLGCGFDTSDLQRSFVTPQWMWSGSYSERVIRPAKKITTITHAERVSQRLRSISHLFGWNDIISSERFLLETGNDCLFNEDLNPPERLMRKLYKDSKIASQSLSVNDFPYTLSFAELWNGRLVYWDITPGLQKWATVE